jgi:hypothetical protein
VGTIQNLIVNPSVKNNSTGWSGTGGVRVTGATGLPRSTAWEVANTDTALARGDCVAGETYRGSVYVKGTGGASTGTAQMQWRTSGAAFIGGSTSVPWSVTNGGVTRIDVGAVVAPPTAALMQINIAGIDAQIQVTAALYTHGQTLYDFFDGDSTDAVWDGTDGNSTSTLTTTDVVGTDGATLSESSSFEVQSDADQTVSVSESAFLVTMEYSDERGRVRVQAFGLPDSVVRAVVYSKSENQARYSEVRGGRVAVEDGEFVKAVDDYEFLAGGVTTYKIVGLSTAENVPDVIVREAVVQYTDDHDQAWLKVIAQPYLNRKINLTGWGPIGRSSRHGVFDVQGRVDPVVVTDVHSSRGTAITVRTLDRQSTLDLDLVLAQGSAMFLHMPPHWGLPSMYAVVGNYSYTRESVRSLKATFEIPLTEVSAPPLSVVGATITCQLLLDTYADCQEVLDTFDTCQAVLD